MPISANIHLVFPLKIKKKTNVANNITADEITVNNFFAHWIKEIDIKGYGDDVPILPLTNMVEVYNYSDAQLKHVPNYASEVLRYDLLYSKKKVKLPAGQDRRAEHTAAGKDANKRTDDNIDDRIEKFQDQLKTMRYYRIPLKYICDIGLVNQPVRFNTQWQLTFETNMQRLFESKANQAAAAELPNSVDAKIVLDSAPYVLYHQFDLGGNFRTYLEGATISENNPRTGLQRTPLQKSYEIAEGSQSRTITVNNTFKQFSFLEVSLVCDRSDQHLSIYDSYNAEIAATHIKSIKLQNTPNKYSEFKTVKFDLEDEKDQYTLHNAFTAWVTKGSSIAPQSDYAYNDTYQQLSNRSKHFTKSDEYVYIHIRRSTGVKVSFSE